MMTIFYRIFIFLTILFLTISASAQTIKILHEDSLSLRGLSVVNNEVLWISGSKGTVARSIDGGDTWKWMKVSGFENTDFRDIEAFDQNIAVIMGISEPAYILRTTNGGESWQTVYENKTPGIFLDAMEFWNDRNGIVIGDPIKNKFFLARTFDGGKTWQPTPDNYRPLANSGEACFAASGTNIRKLTNTEAVFITGGFTSNIYIGKKKFALPIVQGTQTSGANSIAIKNRKTMIVVGGDFTKKEDTTKNCVITFDGGQTWIFPTSPPEGYRSSIEFISKSTWITCGLTGVDMSYDDGKNWSSISKESFHVVSKAKKGKTIYFAGNNGKIGKLIL